MFDKEYTFTGKHAEYVRELTSNPYSEDGKGRGVFQRNIDVYMAAPLIGLLYDRTADKDNNSRSTTKIFTDQFISRDSELQFILFTVLLNDRTQNDPEQRIQNSFQNIYEDNSRDNLENLFDQYLLGGVEVLHEKIIDISKSIDDIVDNFHLFMEEFNDLFATPAHLMQSFDKELTI